MFLNQVAGFLNLKVGGKQKETGDVDVSTINEKKVLMRVK